MLNRNIKFNINKAFPLTKVETHFFFLKFFKHLYLQRRTILLVLALIRAAQNNRINYFILKCLLEKVYRSDSVIAFDYFTDLEEVRWKFSTFFLPFITDNFMMLLEFYLQKVDIFQFEIDMFYDKSKDFSQIIVYEDFFLRLDLVAFFVLYVGCELWRTVFYNVYIITQVCFYEHGAHKFLRRTFIENLYLRPQRMLYFKKIRTFKPGRPRKALRINYFEQHWTGEHLKYRFMDALLKYKYLLYFVNSWTTVTSYYYYCEYNNKYLFRNPLSVFLKFIESWNLKRISNWFYFRAFGEFQIAADSVFLMGALKYCWSFHSRLNTFLRIREVNRSFYKASSVEYLRFLYFYGHKLRESIISDLYFINFNVNHYFQVDLYNYLNSEQFNWLNLEENRFNYINIISILINDYLDTFLATYTSTIVRFKYWKLLKNWVNLFIYIEHYFEDSGFFEFWEMFNITSNRFFLSLDYFFWRIYNPLTELAFLDNRLDLMYLFIKIDIDTIIFSRYLSSAMFIRRFFRGFNFDISFKWDPKNITSLGFSNVYIYLLFLMLKQFYIKCFKVSKELPYYAFFMKGVSKDMDMSMCLLDIQRQQSTKISAYIINFHAYNLYFHLIKKPVVYVPYAQRMEKNKKKV